MKPGPIIAMIVLVFLGMWLVLQPALARSATDITISVGAIEIMLDRTETADGLLHYKIIAPEPLRSSKAYDPIELDAFISLQIEKWNARPAFERHLLGFFNITTWGTFWWVMIGLIGQSAFFGRMFVQWIISERSQISTVPEIFWWFSFIGGICLFTYFVWRVDIVGVMGQSTGIVIYARNLRLLHKQRKRQQPNTQPSVPEQTST
ncbi:MAG: lipid-A-disaccharide synthase N-terminal domain-containing protein [Phycisphaerales bacterium]|nr:lipid-A-disaccharide synthase N-terminal domain-containing protein [Phycisphaerales bacterium]